ncbi:MAG: AlkZ family DNA glycosylase [Anaerolineales bacterium]|nr:AlkZ family DNA glycosylase [Anaerolineales bacterium]
MNSLDIAHHRLHNQKLLQTTFTKPSQVVTYLGAVQAQDYAGAKWALAQRIKSIITDAEIDQAFADGAILRTHLMRPTWHFVSPADIRWMLMLTAPRVHAVNAYMYRKAELDNDVLKKGKTLLVKALQDKQLTRDELRDVFEQAGISMKTEFRMTYMMMWAELEGVICSGARKGKQFTYALLEERVPQAKVLKREEALVELIRRYFTSRGPATLHDFTWWSGLTMEDAKNGIEMVKSEFIQEDINGKMYWFSESKSSAKEKFPVIHLLPNYDEYFIGFKDRSAIGNRVNQPKMDQNSTALNIHIIFINGQIVGGWKRTITKNEVVVELNLLTSLTKAENQAITVAAQRYSEFLGIPITLK